MTTVFFAGGEDSSFNAGTSNSYAVYTNTSSFRGNFARCSMGAIAAPETNIPPIQRLRSAIFANQVTLWTHAWVEVIFENSNPGLAFFANDMWLGWMDSTQQYRLALRSTGNGQQLELVSINAAGTVTHLAYSTTTTPINTEYPLQAFDVEIIYSTSGLFNFYVNGVLQLTYSGNLVTDSATGIGAVDFLQTGAENNPGFWSEMLVQDTDTRGRCVYTMPPLANGATNTWGGNVGNVDETQINDMSYNYTGASNQEALYTTSTTLPPGTYTIEAFVQEARVSVGSSGPQNFDFLVRTVDGTVTTAAPATSPLNYFSNFAHVWETNPHTGVAWVPSDFGTGFNYGIESLT